MTDCSSTWLSQDLPYGKAKIRENTKYWKAIPLCGSVNFRLPTIRTTIEDWQLQSGFTCPYAIFTRISKFPECRYEIASLTSGAISKHEAVFGDCRSEQQIFSCFNFISSNFYWPHILKGKADGMHLQNHLLRRRRFSRFSDGIWQETRFGKW